MKFGVFITYAITFINHSRNCICFSHAERLYNRISKKNSPQYFGIRIFMTVPQVGIIEKSALPRIAQLTTFGVPTKRKLVGQVNRDGRQTGTFQKSPIPVG